MRRITIIAVSLLTLLLFAGCTGNLFMQWDKPDVPSVSEINNKDVSDDSGAESFFSEIETLEDADMLSDDKETSDALVNKLKELYDPDDPDYQPGVSDDTRQKAAAYAGEIAIKSDPNAIELTNNMVAVLPELTSDSQPDDLLASLVPESVKDDPSTFKNLIETILTAGEAYLVFGESLKVDGTIDSSNAAFMEDKEFTDAMQRAGSSIVVLAAIDALDGNLNGIISDPADTEITELLQIVNGSLDWASSTAGSSEDPTNTFQDSTGPYSGLYNVIEAAGFSFS